MPKALSFPAKSVVYFEGDEASKVFLLQTGAISLSYQDIESGSQFQDLVQAGEFFGVKSALGHYPREENAMAGPVPVSLVSFSVAEFEVFAAGNTTLIMKMLKVFSNQLRRVHRQVSNLLDDREIHDPESGLFNVGEYYLKNRRFTQAQYIFRRFLDLYPDSEKANAVVKKLGGIESYIIRQERKLAARAKPEEG